MYMVQQENPDESAITIPRSDSWLLFIEAEESRDIYGLQFRYWLTTTATKVGLKCAITNVGSESKRKYMLQVALRGSHYSVKEFFNQLQSHSVINKKQRPKYRLSKIFKHSGQEEIDYTHHLLCLIAELMNRGFMETSKNLDTMNLGSDITAGTAVNNTRNTGTHHPRKDSHKHKQKKADRY